MAKLKTALILGDKHLPYEDASIAKQIYTIIKAKKPDYIIQIGDLYDFYWFSRYPKHLLSFGPEVEVNRGRAQAEKFWATVRRLSPESECYQLKGNHCDRPQKMLLKKAPELEVFFKKGFRELFEFPGVTTIHDSKQELELNIGGEDVLIQHGHRSAIGDHMKYNRQSTAVGHSHVGGTVFMAYRGRILFELNSGFSGDINSLVFRYGEQRIKPWTPGLGEIDELGPRFIPLRSTRGRKG
jgi:predicted phosphodiesterase